MSREVSTVIEFDNVTKRYDDGTVAVDRLSLTAANSEITVLVGPSGCGKTTSLRMINRTIPVTSGTLSVDGDDVETVDAVQLRRRIGYVIQHAGLFPHRTVIDNVTTVPHLLGWDKKTRLSVGLELMERVGLDTAMAKRYPAQLSGGQQQRVGVARALAADPPMLLMDEPFSAVDPIVREQLQDEFLRLQHELDKTIVFVTHDIDEAIKLGDKVAVMRVGGTLAQFASPAELLSRPVDDFVADFIGRDRGYRGLSFVPAEGLPVHDRVTVTTTATSHDVRQAAGDAGHVLVLDTDRRPVGWLPTNGHAGVAPDRLLDIGTTFTAEQPLRAALDGALASPTGEAVCVDEEGRYVGVVDHTQIADHLASRRPRQAPA